MAHERLQQAAVIMNQFAERTGMTSLRPQKRYLWTDAFAVMNFLQLNQLTGEQQYQTSALKLVDAVHRTLGRHRDDDSRKGWISGLDETEGDLHPTIGGLRIGKSHPERGEREPFDDELEWDRDGQYFHYLTKWMEALRQVGIHTKEVQYLEWAKELAATAHRAFTYTPKSSTRPRMFWKMSIDLSRPLVPSMGHHDPLDGLVSCLVLKETITTFTPITKTKKGESTTTADADDALNLPILDFQRMLESQDLATTDSLGLGGLLMDAARLQSLPSQRSLQDRIFRSAAEGLRYYRSSTELGRSASHRLAFRELGLSIGLGVVRKATGGLPTNLQPYAPLQKAIADFWMKPSNQAVQSWKGHREINEVMLATALLYLDE